jgi:hypothetical protein
MSTPKLAVTVGHFVSSCACFLFFWPKIGRYLMSLGCPYYNPNNPAKPKNLKAKTTPKQPSAKNNAQPPFAAQ